MQRSLAQLLPKARVIKDGTSANGFGNVVTRCSTGTYAACLGNCRMAVRGKKTGRERRRARGSSRMAITAFDHEDIAARP